MTVIVGWNYRLTKSGIGVNELSFGEPSTGNGWPLEMGCQVQPG